MNTDLIKKNKAIRSNRPLTVDNILYSTFEGGNIFQICFQSRGCKNYLVGLCIMCDYGIGRNLTPKEIAIAFDNAISEAKQPFKMLLLNSYGSILDDFEISDECLIVLLDKLKEKDVETIIFETHYTTVTKEKLELIRTKLKDRHIALEFGFETANPKIREECLLKQIDNNNFAEIIKLAHSFNMGVMVNLLVGIPFLTPNEQLDDVLSSINWLSENKVDEIDLFPINVKPYTLLNELYRNGKYDVISQWLLIEVLNRVNIKDLDKIYLSWFGNRKLDYGKDLDTIFPRVCEKCHDKIFDFYAKFLTNGNPHYRKELLTNLFNSVECNCYDEMINSLNEQSFTRTIKRV